MNPYKIKTLETKWFNLCEEMGVDFDDAVSWWEYIFRAYSNKDRKYHNIEHLFNVINAIEKRHEQYPPYYHEYRILPMDDYKLILLAAWFHDVVYEFNGTDNELASAGLASEFCFRNTNLSIENSQFVHDLIMATKHEVLYLKTDLPELSKRFKSCAAILCDADISSMSANWNYFKITNENIRLEYSMIPDDQWAIARKAFFKSFLDRGGIFNLSIDGEEERALQNIERMLNETK